MRRPCRSYALCFASLGVVALGSSGCVSSKGAQRLAASHLAATATSYNLAIERTQNEMMLLNVIRAMNHQPMYFTDASKVTGTVKVDLSLGLKLPVDASVTNKNDYIGMPTIDYSTSPAMDVNLLNSKDFMTGFLAPIPQEFFAYYWDQGWPSEFILYLLVLKVDVYRRIDPKDNDRWSLQCTLHNHPDVYDSNLGALHHFASWVNRRISTGRPTLHSEDSESAKVGPPWPGPPATAAVATEGKPPEPPTCGTPPLPCLTLDQLVNVATGMGLSLSPDATRRNFQLARDKKVYTLVPAPPLSNDEDCGEKEAGGESRGWSELTEATPNQIVMGSKDDQTVYALNLRSSEGVLYYLGELARLEKVQGRAVLIHVKEYERDPMKEPPPLLPLFVALLQRDRSCMGESVSVRALDRKDYFIPQRDLPLADDKVDRRFSPLLFADTNLLDFCSAGRSMMALNLVDQLIGLQKPPKDSTAPSTTSKDSGGGSKASGGSKKGGTPASP